MRKLRLTKVKILARISPQVWRTPKLLFFEGTLLPTSQSGQKMPSGTTPALPTPFNKSQFDPGSQLRIPMKSQGQVAQESSLNRVYSCDWVGGCREYILKKTSFISNPRGNMQPNSPCPRACLWEHNTHNLRAPVDLPMAPR